MIPYHVGGSDRRKNPELMALKRALVVSNIPAERSIHLLGLTTVDEFKWYFGRNNVMSIDTDVPIKAGLSLQPVEEYDRATQIDEDIPLTQETWAAVCRNLAYLRKVMSR